jgi:phasin family protein
LKETDMTTTPDILAIGACTQQLETAMSVIEAITAGSKKMREAQIKAAAEAHASAEALHKRIAGAGDAQELWRIQSEWTSANLGKVLAYWSELYEIALATQASIARCLTQQAFFSGPQAPAISEVSNVPLLEMMDTAYKRWLETTRQFHAAPIVSAPQVRQPA